jgi:ABC-type lipoprotein release transport system permease subunit
MTGLIAFLIGLGIALVIAALVVAMCVIVETWSMVRHHHREFRRRH